MRAVLAKISLAVLAPLILLGSVELVLTLVGVRPLAEDQAFTARAKHRTCQFGWRAAERFCDPARLVSPRRHTIVALGGSSVAGYPFKQTVPFAQPLQRDLDRGRPGQYHVFNRGHMCKDSIFVRDCGLSALAAEPDWLIVYTGHNDFANWGLSQPGRWMWLEENAWIYDLDVSLAHSRLYSALARRVRSSRKLKPMMTAPAPETTIAPRAVTLAKTEENLTTLFEAARRAGTKVVLVTVVSNLWEFPARREEWNTRPGKLARNHAGLADWAAHYQAGIAADRAGDSTTALGEFKLARDAFQQGRAHSALNELLRKLGARYPEVTLVDFEAQLDHLGRDEGIGCNFFGDESFCDQFHPNTRTHELIAHAVGRVILEEGD